MSEENDPPQRPARSAPRADGEKPASRAGADAMPEEHFDLEERAKCCQVIENTEVFRAFSPPEYGQPAQRAVIGEAELPLGQSARRHLTLRQALDLLDDLAPGEPPDGDPPAGTGLALPGQGISAPKPKRAVAMLPVTLKLGRILKVVDLGRGTDAIRIFAALRDQIVAYMARFMGVGPEAAAEEFHDHVVKVVHRFGLSPDHTWLRGALQPQALRNAIMSRFRTERRQSEFRRRLALEFASEAGDNSKKEA